MFGHLSMLCTKKLTLQFLFSIIRKLSSNIKTFDYVILKILSIILMWTLYEVNVTVITNFNNLNFAIFFTPILKSLLHFLSHDWPGSFVETEVVLETIYVIMSMLLLYLPLQALAARFPLLQKTSLKAWDNAQFFSERKFIQRLWRH